MWVDADCVQMLDLLFCCDDRSMMLRKGRCVKGGVVEVSTAWVD
jgi:hypothetical protein